jgi:putative transport protein
MQRLIDLLVEQPLLLLFLVSAVGYVIGRIRIAGVSLGVAAILFVGLAFGALSPELSLPPVLVEMGLIIFVYTIGLSSGAGFFASFNRQGLRNNLLVLVMLTLAAGMTVAAYTILALKPTVTAGMFAGSLTNTPALAGLLDTIAKNASPETVNALLAEPVVGYSVAYPMGVLGMLLAALAVRALFRIDYRVDAERLRQFNLVEQEIYNRTARVTRGDVISVPLSTLKETHTWPVIFGRHEHKGTVTLVDADTVLAKGDLISVIGPPDAVDQVVRDLGEPTGLHLEMDRHEYDFRRVFVSNPEIAGRRLRDLSLPQRYGAVVTRVRRGDIDLLADGDTVLELGDRVRVVARREDIPALGRLFGDSYKALSEIDLLTFGLGLTLGVLLGLIPIPLPGGITFSLGMAGGPLLVGLVLGAVRRTGPLVWSLPYSANLTLRQMGLILLLAGIGIRSGYTFVTTFGESGGVSIFVAGALITMITGFLMLLIGYKVLGIPYNLLLGMLAGMQTQPAVLGFATEQTENEIPNLGYALVFPIATVTKILFAQLLLTLLR